MEERPINLEEKIERSVGRRLSAPDALRSGADAKAQSAAWRNALGGMRIPRGVYRFKTHEEADAWLWQMITRPRL